MGDESIKTIGRYVIEWEIGRGGMAVVYLGLDPRLDRAVAIKLIQPNAFAANIFGHIRERFGRQSSRLARSCTLVAVSTTTSPQSVPLSGLK